MKECKRTYRTYAYRQTLVHSFTRTKHLYMSYVSRNFCYSVSQQLFENESICVFCALLEQSQTLQLCLALGAYRTHVTVSTKQRSVSSVSYIFLAT